MRLLGLDVGPELLGRLRTGHLLPAADRRQRRTQVHRSEETFDSKAFLARLLGRQRRTDQLLKNTEEASFDGALSAAPRSERSPSRLKSARASSDQRLLMSVMIWSFAPDRSSLSSS